ncbi:hypothetical protein E5206_09180 [Arthrobacter sp. PAMC25564]|uniref:hypothetical protein n=1 Tax=Arthrobacter sp. PAMC25564 TaxID=2565366 RepID=UPI0010A249CA|nr:hypothetical protein [Arthrobacter sp. PAMC25564]QCB97083.1 hypothetical protein E5206_09180 [Arthrobacter sp. PAMC25564]
MKTPQPLPEPLAYAPFTFREALDAGASHRRLRRPGLPAPSRGIRIPGDLAEPGFAALVRPVSRITEFSAASHATAFRLWSLPGFLPGADSPGFHISRPDTVAIPRRTGVVGHVGQFFPDEITNLDGVLLTTRARTWLDVSRRMSIDELTVVADHLIRRPRPELEGRREGYASIDELAEMLDREGLPEPWLNPRTELRAGVVRQPDLAYPEYRVAVECEGEGHSEAGQIIRDISREEDFSRAGWTLVRLSKRHMANEARSAVAKVRAALLDRGWAPRG